MNYLFICLMTLLAASGVEHGKSSLPVALYVNFQQEMPAPAKAALQQELDLIMSPIGLKLEWRSLAQTTGDESWIRVAVVHFRGNCSGSVASPQAVHDIPLGRTYLSNGVIIPISEVYCDEITSFLGPALYTFDDRERPAAFGRAAARVLAHELYHVLAKTKHHGSGGVGESSYSAENLVAEKFIFGTEELRKLRSAVMTNLLPFEPGRPVSEGMQLFVKSGCSGCHGLQGEGTLWGPMLTETAREYDSEKLAARLKNSHSEMYRSAHDLNVPWPALPQRALGQLMGFLKTITDGDY